MAKKRTIVVIPSGGLGNRMRVLSSCIEIAKTENRSLLIAWPINSELGCDICDIFESIGIDYSIPTKGVYLSLINFYRHGAIKRFYKFYKIVSKLFFDASLFDNDTEFNHPNIDKTDNSVVVATCFSFREPDLKQFKFTKHLNYRTQEEFNRIGGPYIGIHIRRTDHAVLIEKSPLQSYIAEINKCILINPHQKFYLATDDNDTKIKMMEMYGERLFVSNSKLTRDNLEGIHGAVIDLLLLSKSTQLICSSLSSYSGTAILIGDIKQIIFI